MQANKLQPCVLKMFIFKYLGTSVFEKMLKHHWRLHLIGFVYQFVLIIFSTCQRYKTHATSCTHLSGEFLAQIIYHPIDAIGNPIQ